MLKREIYLLLQESHRLLKLPKRPGYHISSKACCAWFHPLSNSWMSRGKLQDMTMAVVTMSNVEEVAVEKNRMMGSVHVHSARQASFLE